MSTIPPDRAERIVRVTVTVEYASTTITTTTEQQSGNPRHAPNAARAVGRLALVDAAAALAAITGDIDAEASR